MSNKKELTEERKNEIMKILSANKYMALLLLSNSKQFQSIFEPLMTEHILPKLVLHKRASELEVTDESIYGLMRRSFKYWGSCVACDIKRNEFNPDSLQITSDELKEKLDLVDKLIDIW